jgi:hypothetical protein
MKGLETARRLFPDSDLKRAKDHNRAESILLAWFWKEMKQ